MYRSDSSYRSEWQANDAGFTCARIVRPIKRPVRQSMFRRIIRAIFSR